jgi:calcineurin-like phosphoesterase
MNILFIGDIFGSSGRRAVNQNLKDIKDKYKIDLVIANAENCTHGRSINMKHYKALMQAGIQYFTFGNHT